MFYVLQNESDGNLRRVPILLTDAATGTTAQTGIASTNIYPSVNINGGAFAGGAGTVGEAGFGQYYYQMDSTEIGTLGLAGIHITAVGCRDYDAIAQIAAFNVYSPSAGGGISAADVWNYDPSLFNPVTAGEILTDARTYAFNADGQTADIKTTVWQTDPVSYGLPLTGDYFSAYLYQLGTGTTGYPSGGGGGISAYDVWNYTLLSSATTADSTLGNIDSNVTTIQGNTSNIAGTVWNADLSTYTPLANSAGSYLYFTTDKIFDNLDIPSSSIGNSVWSTLTAPYTVHGTYGHQVLRSDNAATIGEVTLHQSGGSKRVDCDVHAFVNNTASATAMLNILTGIGSSITSNITGNRTGNLSGSVGSVSGNVGGNVVGSVASVTAPVSVATASMTGIAGTVWTNASRTITGGTITTVSDKTGYSLSGTQSFNLTGNITGNLSGSVGSVSGAVGSVTGSVGSVTGSVGSVVSAVSLSAGTQASIGNSVWLSNISSYVSPSAGYALNAASGGGVALTAGDIWTYNSRTLTSSAGATAGDVWSYVLSNTDTAEQNLVTAASGGIALTTGDIWSYNTRTLTSGAGITVIGAVQLVNGPYKLTSNQNNSDGILDILQNSVQEINLNLIDGNGSPASTAGYASIINIFDVAGVAVTSYTPTVEYADGGILNFELDTDVTATIGRYNLIVGLSGAGFNVKYGPLQILVRPL